jgi:diguanylate cyclase (GGDEF)-like protein
MQPQAPEVPVPLGWLERLPAPVVILGALALAIGVGWVDALSGFEISLSFFYLLPIALISWARGVKAGLFISTVCALISLWASQLSDPSPSHFVLIWNTAIRFAIFLLFTVLLARVRKHMLIESKLARTDYLTGTLNNRAFYERARLELDRARRYKRPFTVAYLDLDNFKQINDTFGHSIGDAVLRTVAKTISMHVRSIDILARLGGDEFVLLMPETGQTEAQTVLPRLHRLITGELDKGEWQQTLSMGATIFLSCPRHVDEIIHMADHAMYRVKRSNKSSIQFTIYEEEAQA